MTVPSYTEEDVRLIEGLLDDWFSENKDLWSPDTVAAAISVLSALSSAGRLVPPGSENACPKCAEDARRAAEWEAQRAAMSETELHARCWHPDYEYTHTEGPRKQWDDADVPPPGDGWVRNIHAGHPGEGWERFDYHEESYWMRRRSPSVPDTKEGS